MKNCGKKLEKIKYWLSIGKNVKIGPCGFNEILATNVSFEEIWHMNINSLKSLKLPERLISEIIHARENYNPDEVITELVGNGINAITIKDDDYPEQLRQIYNPPPILYYKGTFDKDEIFIGIVGSRVPTDYGASLTREIAYNLSRAGITVVSGLALGIDAIANSSALDAQGRTIAVLGCSLERIYPSTNRDLGEKIVSSGLGAIISEYPVGTITQKQHFPARNRIISGLSIGLVVAEAAENSGSLITACSALEQNREVFAFPGSIYNKNCKGTNNLIKNGAHLITNANDVLDVLNLITPKEIVKARKILPRNTDEKTIFEILNAEPLHINEIIKRTNLPQAKISSVLTLMEIEGKVKHLGGMVYKLSI